MEYVQSDLSLEQSKLRGDVEVVRRYGEAHPDAWVEVRYENEPTVRIVALFAGGKLDLHRDALRRLVPHPDQLEVRSSSWPLGRLEEIRAEIHEMATSSEPSLFQGWGTGGGKVSVRLRADGDRLAAQLQEKYGDAVDLTVGFLHFPDCGFPDSTEPAFASSARPRPELLPEQLHVITDEDLEVSSGANLRSTICLINEGSTDVVVSTNGQLTALVIDPNTNEPVGSYAGAQTLSLVRFTAPTARSVEIPLLVGTASADPRLGYAIPPGRWAVEIPIALGDGKLFRAPLLPLSIVA
jgi:hypothetical protein